MAPQELKKEKDQKKLLWRAYLNNVLGGLTVAGIITLIVMIKSGAIEWLGFKHDTQYAINTTIPEEFAYHTRREDSIKDDVRNHYQELINLKIALSQIKSITYVDTTTYQQKERPKQSGLIDQPGLCLWDSLSCYNRRFLSEVDSTYESRIYSRNTFGFLRNGTLFNTTL